MPDSAPVAPQLTRMIVMVTRIAPSPYRRADAFNALPLRSSWPAAVDAARRESAVAHVRACRSSHGCPFDCTSLRTQDG